MNNAKDHPEKGADRDGPLPAPEIEATLLAVESVALRQVQNDRHEIGQHRDDRARHNQLQQCVTRHHGHQDDADREDQQCGRDGCASLGD